MSDDRYSSGTSLEKTRKEELLDKIDEQFDEPLDDFYLKDMHKLNCETLRQLLVRIRQLNANSRNAANKS